ncbi:Cu-processing system ATP-binding protein [Arcicella rosea]|jgi:Cu-processing system ATP-binding protein|uniref:ABC transporter ATP-binding protein n=1 Tax=Flectobacillus longus TaxID=2984207 RepID=A0ABT6YTN6_9BACT|nr:MULTISPECIES: ABC transporter ATP-binding protein [Spirosomataceae]NBA78546.1 ATP-binding cassette domain-containing protein [Emticicia sp. ODNR4P]MDI9866962.1 ABC transporter ATP-binding protein [Flectobacillus longus]MDI9880507.1 ABC transporter ATP-binding protein [Flectobacillus longus]MDR6563768.1 Cu-processing system ATP-binding protein [Arcicella sp. BE51]MDR6813548.1 Cu-processing system ATP-binding protein [Arcicella sp. BE140]
MIRFENISKTFGKHTVLQNIALTFEQGQAVAIVGPNGSGKTTLIKSLLGMVIPDTGSIYVDNQNIKHDFSYRSKIGYMPQIGHYPPNLSIRQLIEMMTDIRKGIIDSKQLDFDIIKDFELEKIYEKKLGTLSGGTKQKVSAALAFLFDPQILILDEPTAGLDPLASEILKQKIFKEKNKGKLILLTSHILSDLEELSSHLLYIQDGQIQLFKQLSQLKEEYDETRLSKIIARLMQVKLSPSLPQPYWV